MRALYGEDLARTHHDGFGALARGAAPWLVREIARAAGRGDTVVDLGCGGGVLLVAYSRAGFAAVGVDASPAMVRLARRAAPRARVVRGSAHDAPLPPCAGVTAVGEVLGYLPPGDAPRPDLAGTFRRVAAALRPGGLFAFDLVVAGRGAPLAYRGWWEGRDWTVAVEVSEDLASRTLRRDVVTFRRAGARWRRTREVHLLQVPARADVERALRAAGFTVRVRRGYGAHAVAARRLVFVARRG